MIIFIGLQPSFLNASGKTFDPSNVLKLHLNANANVLHSHSNANANVLHSHSNANAHSNEVCAFECAFECQTFECAFAFVTTLDYNYTCLV